MKINQTPNAIDTNAATGPAAATAASAVCI